MIFLFEAFLTETGISTSLSAGAVKRGRSISTTRSASLEGLAALGAQFPVTSPTSKPTKSWPLTGSVTDAYVLVVGDAPTGKVGPGGTKNLQVFVCPIGAPSPAANLAINAASFDEMEPLSLASAVALWLSFVSIEIPATCCEILAASSDEILFCPVVFESDTV